MAATTTMYGQAPIHFAKKLVSWTGGSTIKAMLTTSSYTPNQDTHDYKDDVTNEITDSDYTAGGKAFTTLSATYTASSNETLFKAQTTAGASVCWTGTITAAKYMVVYAVGTADSTSPLLCYTTFTANMSCENGTLTVTLNSDGLFKATV